MASQRHDQPQKPRGPFGPLRSWLKPFRGTGGAADDGRIAAYLQAHPGTALLNLGCGTSFHSDWLNLDFRQLDPSVVEHDLRQALPLPDNSCAVVYSSHVLEHFSKALAPAFLKECRRVLAPAGTLRIVVPDLEGIVRLYLKYLEGALAGDAKAASRYEWIVLELLDQLVREQSGGEVLRYWQQNPMPAEDFVIERVGQEVLHFCRMNRPGPGTQPAPPPAPAAQPQAEPTPEMVAQFRASGEAHKWMYDRYSLRRLLEEVGFADVRQCAANESRVPGFNAYCLDLNLDGTVRKPDSLFMEGSK